jgi:DNA-binding CsgD family transcriptional regulator/tetratricopeptide (TPR) repeat protein
MGTGDVPRWPQQLLGSEDLPFVGRTAELAVLADAWEHATKGRRRVVLVGGEPGAGKSQLVATASHRCHAEGAAVSLGANFAELGTPFQPFAEILSHLLLEPDGGVLELLSAECVAEISRVVHGVLEARPDASAMLDRAEADDRRRLFDAIVTALRVASEHWPLVLVLEDLHWAGRPSLQLLSHVVRTTTTEQLLVIGTHRTTAPDQTDESSRMLAELLHFDGVARVDVEGLQPDDVVEFLVGCGVDHSTARRSARTLVHQTGGNPFLLRELWRHLGTTGGLESLRGPGPGVPRSIGDTLELRLRELPVEHVSVLELAAVIGDPGDAATLAAASDARLDTALAAIGDGVDTGILRLTGPDAMSYVFVHDLARQVLIERLGPARRAKLHASVAAALETSPRAVDRRSSRLAHHWIHAGPYDHDGRGVHWLIEAGRDAERSLAFEEATNHFERAAAELPDGDDRRAGLVMAAAANAVHSGSFAHGRDLYERLADHTDPGIVAEAAIGYEDACWRPGLSEPRAVELLGHAAQLAPPSHPLHVRVLASLGRALSFVGRHDQALSIGERAIERARELGDDQLLAVALQASLWQLNAEPDRALVQFERSREVSRLARNLSDVELLGQAATYRGAHAYRSGQRDEWAHARRDVELARRRSGQPFYAYMAGCSDYAEAYLVGDFGAARRIVDQLLELGSVFGQDDTEGVHGLQSFMIRRVTGELDQARSFITGDEPIGAAYWWPGLLALYTEFGYLGPARRVVEHVLSTDLWRARLTSEWEATLVFLTEAVVALGDADAARLVLPHLEVHAGRNLLAGHFVAVFGSADRYRGMLLHLLGSPNAADCFDAALQMEQRMDAPVHVAETLARSAVVLDASDPAEAAERRRRAHDLAVGLAMLPLADRTRPRAHDADAGGDVRGDTGENRRFPDGLSQREVEVLRCLAKGYSNREIASELHIAQNTAANHVRNIMQKTSSVNRTQAAIYATRHSLV